MEVSPADTLCLLCFQKVEHIGFGSMPQRQGEVTPSIESQDKGQDERRHSTFSCMRMKGRHLVGLCGLKEIPGEGRCSLLYVFTSHAKKNFSPQTRDFLSWDTTSPGRFVKAGYPKLPLSSFAIHI